MKLLHFPGKLRIGYQEFFYLEQWTALLIGFVCLGVSAWAGFLSFGESANVNGAGFWASASATVKYLLTVAVALIGTALIRFAFFKPRRKILAAPISIGTGLPDERTEGNTSDGLNLAIPAATHRRRG